MFASSLTRFGTCLTSVFMLAHCASDEGAPSSECPSGSAACNASGGSAGASGATAAGATSGAGTTSTAGTLSAGGTTTASGGTTSGGATAAGGAVTGGATAAGGALDGGTNAGGTSAGNAGDSSSAGAFAGTGGSLSSGGTSGMGGSNPTGGAGTAGTAGESGGTGGSAGTAGSGPIVDENGIPLAKPGDTKNESRSYLNLGDMRLIVNKWGSDELGCPTSLSVFVRNDKTFGWDFDRGACGGNKEKPDYPEIEFGIHPFGAGNSLATTPSFSSTTLLPIQIKDITSASVVLDNLSIAIERASTYNLNFEFWLSQRNPVTEADPGVHAELITFFGWQDSWDCDKSGNVQAGDRGFNLCHQDDQWAGGKWRYFQFRLNGGSTNSFSGRIDVKALVEWLVNNAGYSRDLWVTRLEVGSEIDDNTKGSVTLRNITFEINGTSKSAQFDG
jgi:hypothetical protein